MSVEEISQFEDDKCIKELLQLINQVKGINDNKPILFGTEKTINKLQKMYWLGDLENCVKIKTTNDKFIISEDKVYIIPNTVNPNIEPIVYKYTQP